MKLSLRKVLGSAVALVGFTLVPNVHADVEVLFAGGNASQTVLYDRVTNILTGGISGVWISPTNATVRTYRGTITSQPGLGTVTIDFSLLGAMGCGVSIALGLRLLRAISKSGWLDRDR